MANIFLTSKCNLNCSYCFANSLVNKKCEEISIKNFIKAVNFLKKDNNERIGLIGGEPTLHSKFADIINLLIADKEIEEFIIYTNGTNLENYINELTNEKVVLLINCNPPSKIGKEYIKLKQNIELLTNKNMKKLVLGINFNEEDDFSYIFDLLKTAKSDILRFSIAIQKLKKDENIFDYFQKIKPKVYNFLEDCIKNEIIPHNDCNAMPFCLLSYKDKRLLSTHKKQAKEAGGIDLLQSAKTCKPIIDIMPNLEAVRCFGFAENPKISINRFENLQQLKEYFYNRIDVIANETMLKNDCKECKHKENGKCGICYCYKNLTCKKPIDIQIFTRNGHLNPFIL